MNIQEAKTEIVRTYYAYTKRDDRGRHRIPLEKQRPVLLIGPPGIGKTAIMRQIAEETGCGLVAYSMTHHTRQSAIGLPFISHKAYNGTTYAVTEYTMSEIISSVYEAMQRTGKRSGILFLDEINCVSETLTPVILQLLQNKTFGNVPLPEDWIIVAAGNPPEYNRSVRELDMVTLDRVKCIDVEADLPIWQRYAIAQGVHPAVRTYLSVYPNHFYNITNTDRGQLFVTARGWEDLSLMLTSYEEDGIIVDEKWFLQYLQHDEIARSFYIYYEIFRHFAGDARSMIPESGENEEAEGFSLAGLLLASPEKLEGFASTECLAVAAMLFNTLREAADRLCETRKRLARRREIVATLPAGNGFAVEDEARAFFERQWKSLDIKTAHGVLKPDAAFREKCVLEALEKNAAAWRVLPANVRGDFTAFEKARGDGLAVSNDRCARRWANNVERAYQALLQCPQGRSARLYMTSDLAASESCAELLSRFPSDSFEQHRRELEG